MCFEFCYFIFLKDQKILLILWYGVAASSFFQRFSFFLSLFDQIVFEFYLFGHVPILRHRKVMKNH